MKNMPKTRERVSNCQLKRQRDTEMKPDGSSVTEDVKSFKNKANSEAVKKARP
jgi:hypothetical protein